MSIKKRETNSPPSSSSGRQVDQALVCIPKRLPKHQLIECAAHACAVNPLNYAPVHRLARVMPGYTPTREHLAVVTTKYWGNKGVKLSVGFLDGESTALRRMILLHMNEWNKTANVMFMESANASTAQVRVARRDGELGGYWSYLGTDIELITAGEPTFNLEGFTLATPESEFRRVVRHEAGHSLGFPHEHMRQELVARIDAEKAIEYFGRTQGWSPEEVRHQVLTPLEQSSLLGTPNPDPYSIMCYQISGELTVDGRPIPGGEDIDEEDRSFAARVYPRPSETTAENPQAAAGVPTGDLVRDYIALQSLHAQNFAALLAVAGPNAVPASAGLRPAALVGPKEISFQAGSACSLNSDQVFNVIVAVYRGESLDPRPVTRSTPFDESGVDIDPEAVAALALSSIKEINNVDSGCHVTGIGAGEIAAQSSTFGQMADVIFNHLG